MILDKENALAKSVDWEAWEEPPYSLRNQAFLSVNANQNNMATENEDIEMHFEDQSLDDSNFSYNESEQDYTFPFNSTIDETESIDNYDSDNSDHPIVPFVPFAFDEAKK